MALRKEPAKPPAKRRPPPAKTPEGRESQMINLAVDYAEEQFRNGSASSQVTTFYLKLASSREKLEQERIKSENELLKAKVLSLANAADSKVLYQDALNAFKLYSGNGEDQDYDD
jgi:hypothetical protein